MSQVGRPYARRNSFPTGDSIGMARLGAKADVKSLRDLLVSVAEQASHVQGRSLQRWTSESHVRATEESVHVDLHDLPLPLVEEVIRVVLRETPGLWTRKVRFLIGVDDQTLDGVEITPTLIRLLKDWTLASGVGWRISYRPGRPYVDIRRQEDEPVTAESVPVRRRTSHTHHGAEGVASEDLALIGRDPLIDGLTAAALVLAAVPMLVANALLLGVVYNTMGAIGPTILIAIIVGALVAELAVIRTLLRPKHIHSCINCGTLNRIVPAVRRRPLKCGSCAEPIYGAWPILPMQTHACPSCKSNVHIEAEVLVNALPYCPRCENPIATTAIPRRNHRA